MQQSKNAAMPFQVIDERHETLADSNGNLSISSGGHTSRVKAH